MNSDSSVLIVYYYELMKEFYKFDTRFALHFLFLYYRCRLEEPTQAYFGEPKANFLYTTYGSNVSTLYRKN
jgi:hypothetical protein